jgi:hypothetical protein
MARFLSPLHRGPLPGVWMGSPSAVSETPLGSVHTQGWIITARRKCLSVAAVKHLFCLRHSWLFCFKVWDGKMRVLLYTSVLWWGGLERGPREWKTNSLWPCGCLWEKRDLYQHLGHIRENASRVWSCPCWDLVCLLHVCLWYTVLYDDFLRYHYC